MLTNSFISFVIIVEDMKVSLVNLVATCGKCYTSRIAHEQHLT